MDFKYPVKEEIKPFLSPFVVVFLICFLVLNWNWASWLFNYKIVFGGIAGFFQEAAPAALSDSGSGSGPEKEVSISILYPSQESDKLEIPILGISAPLVFIAEPEEKKIDDGLKRGVVHFPNSVLPGGEGQTILLGHSAPPNWPKIDYEWVFSELEKLKKGDEVIIYFRSQKYVYSVEGKTILNKGGKIPENNLTEAKNTLVLISCWPPGKNFKRIAVEAVLKTF